LENINSELNLLKTLKLKADIFSIISNKESTKYLEYSLLNYQLASKLADMIRIGFKAEGSKFLLGDQTSDLYSNAVKTSLRLFSINEDISSKEQAFNFIEKSKSAVLQEGLLESRARQFANLPQSVLDDEKEVKKDISFYKTQLQKELQKRDQKDILKILEHQNRLFGLNQKYDEFVLSLEKNNPAYYELKYQTKAITISEIQKQLDVKTALLQYFVGDSSIYIASVTNENFELFELKKPDNFSELVRTFYSAVIKSENEKYISSSNKLTDLLITPVLNNIKSKDRLVVIPHDALFKVPFEALFTTSQNPKAKDFTALNYLIKDFDVSYHYSASLFFGSMEREKKISSKNFIGFAPVFPKDDLIGYTISSGKQSELLAISEEAIRSLSVDGKTFDELKYSEWEVNSIIDLFVAKKPEQINTAYFYSDAKEDSFKLNAKDYKIVHIASHSFMNEEQPDISGVVFTQPTDSNFTNDGVLYSSETYNLDLSADLVVLSSCESGLGKLFKGEGMIALTRGFLYSGTSNILFSLWKISDKHTSELMVEFYRQMISGKSYSESLRQAKLKLIKNEVTARPRSWAGFLLIGVD
jgi:CHAT domain-containing protein